MATEAQEAIGDVSPSVLARILSSQRESQIIYQQIGQAEVRKVQMIHRLEQISDDIQKLMTAEGMRLGIPEGVPWQMTPEGKVLLMPQKP